MSTIAAPNCFKAAFASCLCTKTSSSPENSDNEGLHQRRSEHGGRSVFARDELEGLLASASSDEHDDTMSLHSNFGGRRKRRTKKKSAWGIRGAHQQQPRSIQVFGWYPFGRPIALPADEDDQDSGAESSTFGRGRRISDAEPLDPEAIARLAQRELFKQNFEPERTSKELVQEEARLAEEEERNAYVPPQPAAEPMALIPEFPVTPQSPPESPTKPQLSDAERRIRKAARQQRRRVREEAERLQREAVERSAEAAAGGFDFGDFASPQMTWSGETETISEDTSDRHHVESMLFEHSPLQVVQVAEEADEHHAEDDDNADFGAEYASIARKRLVRLPGAGGSSRSGSDSGIRGAAKVPAPPSSTGSDGHIARAMRRTKTHRSQTSGSTQASGTRDPLRPHRALTLPPTSPQDFDGVPGGLDIDDTMMVPPSSHSVSEDFDGTPGGLDQTLGGFGSSRSRKRPTTVDIGSPTKSSSPKKRSNTLETAQQPTLLQTTTKFPSTGFGRPRGASMLNGAALARMGNDF